MSTILIANHWHNPLFVSGGDYWRQRIRVEIANSGDHQLKGKPVQLKVGANPGEVDLAGRHPRSLRVVDDSGTEVLFALSSQDGEASSGEVILESAFLTIPVDCSPHSSVVYWIYFDNPSAWPVPDFLRPPGLVNGGVEEGSGSTPSWWQHDRGDPDHQASWVEESPFSGRKCLKLQVTPGASNSWISTRQNRISVEGGRTYTLRGWVKAQDVSPDSSTGWYVHVATPGNPHAINKGVSAGGGTFGWTEVAWTFTTPQDSVDASVGTMLWGSGTAWFDHVSLEAHITDAPSNLQVNTSSPESLHLTELGGEAPWYDNNLADDIHWKFRVPLKVANTGKESLQALASVNTRRYTPRWRDLNPASFRIVDGTSELPTLVMGEQLLFDVGVPALTQQTYYLYFSSDSRITSSTTGMESLILGPDNLVQNPSFELAQGSQPTDWVFQSPSSTSSRGLSQPGLFGEYHASYTVPHSSGGSTGWPGWRQEVPVEPGKTYLYSASVKLDDVRGAVRAHAHLRDDQGELVGENPYLSIGASLSGTTDWTQLSGTFTIPPGATTFQIHLTMNATGTLSHDGVVLMEGVTYAVQGPVQAMETQPAVRVWQVPAVVKVFEDDHPLPGSAPVEISAAGNDLEPLQLAIRSSEFFSQVRVEVDAPRHYLGTTLDEFEVAVVGFVPVAHTSDYYGDTGRDDWVRPVLVGKPVETGILPSDFGQGSDGWVGWWPDPLLPSSEFHLLPKRTQPVWITFRIPPGAPSGDYTGEVRLVQGSSTLARVPFTLHVWGFDLPSETHATAIYDVRPGSQHEIPDQDPEVTQEKLLRLMAEHRVSPDRVLPEPFFQISNGSVSADYEKFDEAASFFLDTLDFPQLYMPLSFYLFGWARPPTARFGEAPYPGEYPYPGADRSVLRPEFKNVYQKVLTHFWKHLNERGWDERFVLYISDEPHYWEDGVIEQMQALCDMIHGVDPAIPIYSSVWNHIPEWDGYLDVWGIGHYGIVSPGQIQSLLSAGDRLWFTTDGHMCIDTPYLAIERLLPHLAFRYGIEGYEFWGVDWDSGYDPYRFGWHAPVEITQKPEDGPRSVIYPNGDGYLVYPGAPAGMDRAIPTIRLAQAREGQEDYELLFLLESRMEEAQDLGLDIQEAEQALLEIKELVVIPGDENDDQRRSSLSGRWSTALLPSPEALYEAREKVGEAIEDLEKRLRTLPVVPSRGWDRRPRR